MSDEDGVKTVSEQIDDMMNIGTVEPEPVSEPEPVADEPVEPIPEHDVITEPPVEPPVVEPPVEEPPPAEPPVEPPPAPEPEDELTKTKKEVESLRKTIEKMSAPKPTEPEPVKPAEPAPEPPPEPKVELEEIDFIGDADVDDITRDPIEFNKILNKVFAQGADTLRRSIEEGVLRSIPDTVKASVMTTIALKESSDEFYKDNKDLEPFKKVVSNVFEELLAENPDKIFSEILDDVAKESRKRLELYKEAIKPDLKSDDKPPALQKVKGQQRGTPNKPDINPMQAQIDAMNESQF